MLVSLKWLREYVDVPADVDVDDLAHRLTMASAEVEGIHRHGAHWDRDLIRVGEVLEVNQHPDADRLPLVDISVDDATYSTEDTLQGVATAVRIVSTENKSEEKTLQYTPGDAASTWAAQRGSSATTGAPASPATRPRAMLSAASGCIAGNAPPAPQHSTCTLG